MILISFFSALIIKPRLLIIAQPSSYRIAAYLKAATQLNLTVLIASPGKYSLITEVYQGLNIDLDNQDDALRIILTASKENPFVGVIGTDDGTVELAAKVAQQLGLPHNPPEAAKLTKRKDLARAFLTQKGCLTPKHKVIDVYHPLENQIKDFAFPCVIKPLNMSASTGVIRANNLPEFIAACKRVKRLIADLNDSFEKAHVLVEQYIDGEEIAFEGYLQKGKLHELVIFDKPNPLVGPFFEETIYVTPSQHSVALQAQITKRVQQACTAYGLVTGPIHAELRINNNDAWILEIASRTIGGDCSRSLDNGSDFNSEALVIALATNQTIDIKPPTNARGVMMMPIKKAGIVRYIKGLKAARETPNVEQVDILINEGNELIPLPEGNQYPGYIFAQAETPKEVVLALNSAFEKINFVVATTFKLKQL